MRNHIAAVTIGTACLALLGGAASASARTGGAVEGAGLAAAPSPDRKDDAIKRAFRDVLRRDPSSSELRRYRRLMDEENWTESDIRRDLRDQSRDESATRPGDVDRVIRRAYQDLLDRDPDSEGLRSYRRAMIDKGWTERDVREDLRKSPEYAKHQRDVAERLVRRAYEDVLGRQPDPQGLSSYTARVLRDGWGEREVRESLERSPEYRQYARTRAEKIVRDAYRNVLKRDADEVGLRNYVDRVLRDRWTQERIERELRQSDEYKNMRK